MTAGDEMDALPLIVDLVAALAEHDVRACPVCGAVLSPELSMIGLSQGARKLAVEWRCADAPDGFHWSRTDPLR